MCENVRVENYEENFFYRIDKSSCPRWSNEIETTCCFDQNEIFKVTCLRLNHISSSYLTVKNLNFCMEQHDGDECFRRTEDAVDLEIVMCDEYDPQDESTDSPSSATNPVVKSVLYVAIGMLVLLLVYFLLKTWCTLRRERGRKTENNPVLGVEELPTVYPLTNVPTESSTPVVLELEEVVLDSEERLDLSR